MMNEIWFASLLWLASHLGVSSTPLRGGLVRMVGERGYLLIYSIVATASLAYLIWVYTDVPRFEYLWQPDPDLYWPAKLLLPFAFILLVGGFMVKNPSMVGAKLSAEEAQASAGDVATGVTRITRHPFQWSVVIWGACHVLANGDWVSVVFFSAFMVLSFAGSILIDRKKSRTLGDGWEIYTQVTSNVPFAAIVAGRNRLALGELWQPSLVGLLLYALVYYFHEAITGAVII